MPDTRTTYRFGPYQLEPMARSLRKHDERLVLPDRQFDVLTCLVMRAGRIVHKDDLHRTAWGRVDSVSDGSVVMAVKGVRDALGRQDDGRVYIETTIRKGYRFNAPVECVEQHGPDPASPADLCVEHEAFTDGRAAIESFTRDEVARACSAFERVLSLNPRHAAAHRGLQAGNFLRFEATRATRTRDEAQLRRAEHHGTLAIELEPRNNHAWGMQALIHHRLGLTHHAIVEARTAMGFRSPDWMDHVRMAVVTWGNERLGFAEQAARSHPRSAMTRWLSSQVHVARGAFDLAVDELRAGAAFQDEQRRTGSRYAGIGLHFLLGLVRAASGDVDQGIADLEREINIADPLHIYGPEAIANSHYGIGALRLRQRCFDIARVQFQHALDVLPGHPLSTIGLLAATIATGGAPAAPVEWPESDSFEHAYATA
ncbi:MAG: winged helix-turn-helix domain-containing protein, partial [Vicinamibacterales bacterium]